MMRLGWFRAVHVKNVDTQKMRTLLSNRKLLKPKLVDIENHIRGALRTYGLLLRAVSRGRYEARVRELIEHTDFVFATMIETMLDVAEQSSMVIPGCIGWFYWWFSTIRFAVD